MTTRNKNVDKRRGHRMRFIVDSVRFIARRADRSPDRSYPSKCTRFISPAESVAASISSIQLSQPEFQLYLSDRNHLGNGVLAFSKALSPPFTD